MVQKPQRLKHYTSISNLLVFLNQRYLSLGNPNYWKDENDKASLQAFCRLKGNNTEARVLCLAEGEEVYTHWQGYAPKGCQIQFNTEALLKNLKPEFLHGFVNYKPAKEVTASYLKKLSTNKLPFLKRRPYECEKEYRIVWFGQNAENAKIPLDENTIECITLAPDLPVREKIKELLEK